MRDKEQKEYCLVDHANKRKDLAHLPPYDFWVRQLERRGSADSADSGSRHTRNAVRRKAG